MKESLFVSPKGQVTLPAAMRQALGLSGPAIVTAEQKDGRIVLTPAMVVETEVWTDAQVQDWNGADELGAAERQALEARLKRAANTTKTKATAKTAAKAAATPPARKARRGG